MLLANNAFISELRRNPRQLVEQRYDWGEVGRRFVALVEEMGDRLQTLLPSKG